MPQLLLMTWDEQDRLRSTTQQIFKDGTPETTFCAYDSAGTRQRKVTDGQAPPRQVGLRSKERIYLGAVEIYREFEADGTSVNFERETLHIMGDRERVAIVESRTKGTDRSLPQLIRYQLDNHIESASLELDDHADVISYEEYFPYGSTAYQAVRSQTETPKRYRYTGKERDEENDFYYHGARYYAPWLGRWVSPDPAGLIDGTNLYEHARANPIALVDPAGLNSKPPRTPATIRQGEDPSFFSAEYWTYKPSTGPLAALEDPNKITWAKKFERSLEKAKQTLLTTLGLASGVEILGGIAGAADLSATAVEVAAERPPQSVSLDAKVASDPAAAPGSPALPNTLKPSLTGRGGTELEGATNPPNAPWAETKPITGKLDPRGTGNNPILPEETVRHEIVTRGRHVPQDVVKKIEQTMQREHPGMTRGQWEVAHDPAKPFVLTMEGEKTKVFGQIKILNQKDAQKIGAFARKIRQLNKDLPPEKQIPIRPPRPWGAKGK